MWNYHGEESDDDDDYGGGGDGVPFDGSDGGGDDMSDDDHDEMLDNICQNLWMWVIDDLMKLRKEDFTLRAALLWTINDFSAYGMLSGWSVKGYNACPTCMDETSSHYLKWGRKVCYTGHRRFLPLSHKWRKDKTNFDGLVDNRAPIAPKSGDEVLHDIECSIGVSHSMVNKKKRKYLEGTKGWNKKSVFFNLPYWAKLKVRHNIDIMHVVKNVTESLTGTLFNIKGKTKDTWKSRQDLMDRGLKKSLHLQRRGESVVIPMACYHLTKDEKHKISNLLMSLKFPDGLASNISRGSLTKEVRLVIYELSEFIRIICSRTMHLDILEKLEEKIIVILCKLERMFPPSFFDIMTHLLIHLPYEAKISGPPEYRWMFPFERKMHVLKGYVTNKARPEGCIAQRYIENECVTFCSMYLNDVDTVFNKSEHNDEMIHPGGEIFVFSNKGRPIGGYKTCDLSEAELMKIHTYILNNCPKMRELINEHKVELEEENFNHVNTHLHSIASEIRILSCGPLNSVNSYSGCMVNGYKFHTQTREENRTCQNSGVVVKGDHGSSMIDYFKILQEVLEVVYLGGNKRVLVFKCECFKVDNVNGLQVDKESGSTSVNTSRKWYVDQPYILASQAKQVFYVPDLKLGRNWYVVESNDPRTLYNVPVEGGEAERHHVDEVFQEEEPHLNMPVDSNLNQPSLTRGSVPLEVVDASTAYDDSRDDEFSDDDDDDIDSTKSLSSSHEESPLDDCSDSE
ncbi:uncharacterized protein Tco_0216036 [Tanacetum coccineum]